MKRSDKTVSLPQSESPSDPDISLGTETLRPPLKVVTLDPLVFPLPSVSVYPFDLHASPWRALWSLRKIPSTDMERRQSGAAKLKAHLPKQTAHAWQRYRERILSKLREGNLETFHDWLHHYGPRALWLALSEPEVLAMLEGWWIDGPVLKDEATRKKLATTLRMVSEQKLYRDTEYLSAESKERKGEKDAEAKLRYNRQADKYLTDLKSNFFKAIEKLPQSVKRDPQQLQTAKGKIRNKLLALEPARKKGPWRRAVKDFQAWVNSPGKKK